MTMQKEIAKIEKNSQEQILVQITSFKEHDLVDLRVWIKPLLGEKDAKSIPTKKGLTISPELLPELVTALVEAGRVYEESQGRGLTATRG